MKKLIILLFLFTHCGFSQTKNDSISISFENEKILNAIEKIETSTSLKFYFDKKWLEKEQKTVTKTFNKNSLEEILEYITNNTKINFFINNNEVIFSENRIIYDYFPDNYFGNNNSLKIEQSTVIENKNDLNKEVIYLGKGTKIVHNKKFTITGNVKNIEKYNDLSDITISSNKNISTKTDQNGNYSIVVPQGLITITAELPNAKGNIKHIFVNDNGVVDFFVTEKTIGMKEIVVTSKIQNKIKNSNTGTTIIDLENMKNVPILLGEQDVFKIATITPGIKTAGEGSTGLNVRGGNTDQNLILVDDIPLYNPFHFLGFFSSINPFSLKNVTIYKGSIPVEFGGRLSSVMDLKTKNPNNEKLSGKGGIGPITSNMYVNLPVIKNKSSVATGLRATYSDWILKSLKNEELKNSNASFYDFSIKYKHDINENNTLNTFFYYSNDKFKISSDSLFKYNNRLLGLNWEHKFSKKSDLTLNINNSLYKYGIDYNNHLDDLKSYKSGFNINESNFSIKTSYKSNQYLNLNLGITEKYYKINPGFLNPKNQLSILTPINLQEEKALESSLFIKNEIKLNDKFLINLGVRFTTFLYLGPNTQKIYQNNVYSAFPNVYFPIG